METQLRCAPPWRVTVLVKIASTWVVHNGEQGYTISQLLDATRRFIGISRTGQSTSELGRAIFAPRQVISFCLASECLPIDRVPLIRRLNSKTGLWSSCRGESIEFIPVHRSLSLRHRCGKTDRPESLVVHNNSFAMNKIDRVLPTSITVNSFNPDSPLLLRYTGDLCISNSNITSLFLHAVSSITFERR